MGKNRDGLVWKSDVVKKLQEHVGVPAKVWAGMLIRWLDEIEDFEKPEIIMCMDDIISRQDAINIKVSHGINDDCIIYVPLGEVINHLKNLPPAQPTLYGYKIEHLSYIARVMEKEGITAEYAVRTFDDMGRAVKMILDEAHEAFERSMKEWIQI